MASNVIENIENIAENSMNDDVCAICIEPIPKQNVSHAYPCMHKYCFECVKKWCEVKVECPLCKQSIEKILYDIISPQTYHEFRPTVPRPPQATFAIAISRIQDMAVGLIQQQNRIASIVSDAYPGFHRLPDRAQPQVPTIAIVRGNQAHFVVSRAGPAPSNSNAGAAVRMAASRPRPIVTRRSARIAAYTGRPAQASAPTTQSTQVVSRSNPVVRRPSQSRQVIGLVRRPTQPSGRSVQASNVTVAAQSRQVAGHSTQVLGLANRSRRIVRPAQTVSRTNGSVRVSALDGRPAWRY